jgi:hypothetical protein
MRPVCPAKAANTLAATGAANANAISATAKLPARAAPWLVSARNTEDDEDTEDTKEAAARVVVSMSDLPCAERRRGEEASVSQLS